MSIGAANMTFPVALGYMYVHPRHVLLWIKLPSGLSPQEQAPNVLKTCLLSPLHPFCSYSSKWRKSTVDVYHITRPMLDKHMLSLNPTELLPEKLTFLVVTYCSTHPFCPPVCSPDTCSGGCAPLANDTSGVWSTTTTLHVVANYTIPTLPVVDQHVHGTAVLSTQINVQEVDARLQTVLLGAAGFAPSQVRAACRAYTHTSVWKLGMDVWPQRAGQAAEAARCWR